LCCEQLLPHYVITSAKKVRLRSDPLPREETQPAQTTSMNALISRHTSHLRSICKPSGYSTRICLRSVNTMTQPVRPRRFAPLDPAKKKEGDDRPVLKGIVFDVDGTLCTSTPHEV
jgi:hypothetical protein